MPHYEEDGGFFSGVSRCCCAPAFGAYHSLAACNPTQQRKCDYVSRILDSLDFRGAARQANTLSRALLLYLASLEKYFTAVAYDSDIKDSRTLKLCVEDNICVVI